jgi:hypothetical protein
LKVQLEFDNAIAKYYKILFWIYEVFIRFTALIHFEFSGFTFDLGSTLMFGMILMAGVLFSQLSFFVSMAL